MKLTPKQRVLKRWPDAFSMKRPFGVVIYVQTMFGPELGCAVTARGAWKAAALKLRSIDSSAKTP